MIVGPSCFVKVLQEELNKDTMEHTCYKFREFVGFRGG